MGDGCKPDVLTEVESLLNKLESLPDNVKQVAVSKIRARLLKKDPGGVYEDDFISEPSAVELSEGKCEEYQDKESWHSEIEICESEQKHMKEETPDSIQSKSDDPDVLQVNRESWEPHFLTEFGLKSVRTRRGRKAKQIIFPGTQKSVEDVPAATVDDWKKDVEVSGETSNQSVVTCSICDFQCARKKDLRQHITKSHGFDSSEHEPQNQIIYACSECNRTFQHSYSLKIHMKRHRGQRDFACTYCEYRAFTKIDCIRHMTIHTGERNQVCEYCGKTFAKDSTLREHVRAIHERPQQHICDQCGFTTYRANNLHVHIRMKHKGEYNNHVCPVCGARLKQRTAFLEHMRSHTGDKPYKCDLCESSFACAARLTVHKKSVHMPRSYHCSVCTKVFQTKHHLARHEVIHTKERPFACPYCPYSCNTQGNLSKHIKIIHNQPDFSYRKYKAELQIARGERVSGDNLDPEWVEKGQKVGEEYLAQLSERLGHPVTLEELREKEKNRQEQMQELLRLQQQQHQQQMELKQQQKSEGSKGEIPIIYRTHNGRVDHSYHQKVLPEGDDDDDDDDPQSFETVIFEDEIEGMEQVQEVIITEDGKSTQIEGENIVVVKEEQCVPQEMSTPVQIVYHNGSVASLFKTGRAQTKKLELVQLSRSKIEITKQKFIDKLTPSAIMIINTDLKSAAKTDI